jgi:hypothetical protein
VSPLCSADRALQEARQVMLFDERMVSAGRFLRAIQESR